MIAVIFEVTADPAHSERYLGLAAELRAELDRVDGFVSIERFQSLAIENKYVSFSFWRDREAVEAWYARADVLLDYRIRVADVFRDYDMASARPGGPHGAG